MNIKSNLPDKFNIRPTIPFSFFDCELGDTRHLRMTGESYYTVISGNNGRYLIMYETIVKGFISEKDLVDGIVKGKLEVVK